MNKADKISPPSLIKARWHHEHGIRSARPAERKRDFTKNISGARNVEDDLFTIGMTGTVADAPHADAIKGIAIISFEK